MPTTVSDLVLDRLTEWGVDTVFGLPGDGINGFMEALRLRRDDVRFVHTRHEESAALRPARTAPAAPAWSGRARRRRPSRSATRS